MTETPRVPFDDLTMAEDQLMTWRDRPFTGVAIEAYPDGSPRSESAYREGLVEGLSRLWYPSGQIKEEASYWRGARHGITREWTERGQLRAKRTYEFGILVREQTWNDDGTQVTDWHIAPDHNLYQILQLSRSKYVGVAPPV
jgi:antitoxin component YwqK of YwqJK toxin-antitoxin module